ncbi:nucleotide-diphospho-sugar transferase [Elsinoe ampelina]|uniref:Nucleotide-diphospho-sugar transferase n=1 Tax=Elsinoe ampelina TaxID=302913 RepID=A0A6A6FXL3_9PEZI|nr:nucleotide-diphospho-sugar transferase [Elsinoe ampelina]
MSRKMANRGPVRRTRISQCMQADDVEIADVLQVFCTFILHRHHTREPTAYSTQPDIQIGARSVIASTTYSMLGRKRVLSLVRQLLVLTPGTSRTASPLLSPSDGWLPEKTDLFAGELDNLGQSVIVENDTKDWLTINRFAKLVLLPLLPFVGMATLALQLHYYVLTMGAQWHRSGYSWRLAFSVVELLVLAPDCMKTIVDALVVLLCRPRRRLLALGADLPGVDLVIACCGEDVDIILDTVRAALDLDYPSDRLRVTVTDDGDSAELRRAISNLQQDALGPALSYTARIKTPDNRNKASNLNHAMSFADNLPGDHFPFFANLDADVIPEKTFLRSSMAHFLLDSNLALTNPPPSCYNQPVNDPLQQTLNVTFKWAELIKDMAGCAWCTGSGFVVKKEAVHQVGGFPGQTLSEDVHLSSMILRGLECCVPGRSSPSVGTIQSGLAMNMYLDRASARQMTLLQRLYMFLPPFREIKLIINNIYMWVSLILLFQGKPFAPQVEDDELPKMVRASAAAFIATGMDLMIVSLATTDRLCMRASANESWMAPYRTIAHIKSILLPGWLGGTVMRFVATGSIRPAMKEREPSRRPNVLRRLHSVMFRDGAWYHALYATLCWVAVASAIRRATEKHPNYSRDFWMYLLLHVAWCSVPWLFHSVAFMIPIS